MKRYRWLLIAGIAIVSACKSDKTGDELYDLDGKWEVYEAYRDGELTTTLEDAYFEFLDSILTTNLMGEPISGPYSLTGDEFIHDSNLKAEYEIEKYTGDTMHLETEIRKFDFLFKLKRERDTIPSSI